MFSVGQDSGDRPWRVGQQTIMWYGAKVALTDKNTMTFEEAEQLCKILNDHKFEPRI